MTNPNTGRPMRGMGTAAAMLLLLFFAGCESISTSNPPVIDLSTENIVFRVPNQAETTRVRNLGDGALSIQSARITGGGAEHFELASGFSTTLEAQEQMFLEVTWLGTGGAPSARLTLTTNDPQRNQVNVNLSVEGGAPRLAISTEPVRFGIVPAGMEQRRSVDFFNVGNSPLTITAIRVDQPGSDILIDTDLDSILPVTLDPFTDELPLELICQPETDLPVTARLQVTSNDPSSASGVREFTVQCNTAAPCIDVRADGVSRDAGRPIDFDATPFDRTRTKQVYISNCDPRGGDDPLVVSSIDWTPGQENPVYEYDLENLELPLTLGFGEERYFLLRYTPPDTGVEETVIDRTSLRFLSNDEAREEFDVPVQGFGSDYEPPIANVRCRVPAQAGVTQGTAWLTNVQTQPFVRVICSGEESSDPNDLEIVEYLWTVDGPDGSNVLPETTQESNFLLNTVGTFRVSLVVRNSQGLESDAATATVTAIPRGELLFRLRWQHWFGGFTDPANPQQGGCGADLDLHVIPNNGTWYGSNSVYWQNRNVTMGGASGTLDIDVIRGVGPENVTVENPVAGQTYRAAVHSFNDAGFGAADATLEVIIGGVVVERYRRQMERTNTWWDVVAVQWDPIAPDIIEVDNYYGSMCASPFAPTTGCRDRGSSTALPNCW